MSVLGIKNNAADGPAGSGAARFFGAKDIKSL